MEVDVWRDDGHRRRRRRGDAALLRLLDADPAGHATHARACLVDGRARVRAALLSAVPAIQNRTVDDRVAS